jgi:hypothetical protein
MATSGSSSLRCTSVNATLEAQLQEDAPPRTQLAGMRLNYMHEMQARARPLNL